MGLFHVTFDYYQQGTFFIQLLLLSLTEYRESWTIPDTTFTCAKFNEGNKNIFLPLHKLRGVTSSSNIYTVRNPYTVFFLLRQKLMENSQLNQKLLQILSEEKYPRFKAKNQGSG